MPLMLKNILKLFLKKNLTQTLLMGTTFGTDFKSRGLQISLKIANEGAARIPWLSSKTEVA